MNKPLIKPYEFWHPRIFEFPFYCYLAWQCLAHRLPVTHLAKANSALDHGEIGIGSKYHTQQQFDQQFFLPTQLVDAALDQDAKRELIKSFAAEFGFPVILKPDIGMVGKGIVKVDSADAIDQCVAKLRDTYIVQQFTPFKVECGVFYVRKAGVPMITGINQKHFPAVTGNGVDTILTLAENHYRYTDHWSSFLQYFDTSRVPEQGENVRLSFIGSHTMGCKFTDDTHLLTPSLEQAVFKIFEHQPDFNFGRLDVKAESIEALLQGDFVVIEINGVSSLPTHMFDPANSLLQAYKIFMAHGKHLVEVAYENRFKPMELMSLGAVLQKVKSSQQLLDNLHSDLKSDTLA